MKDKFKFAFMDVASRFAKLSSAKRAQVGAIIVKDDRIISIGYNGMPSGWSNECEYDDVTTEFKSEVNIYIETHLTKTKPEVIHAESNAISKVAQRSESSKGASLFCTHMPCINCAKLIYQSGISHVYVKDDYVAAVGVGREFLEQCDITLEFVNDQSI